MQRTCGSHGTPNCRGAINMQCTRPSMCNCLRSSRHIQLQRCVLNQRRRLRSLKRGSPPKPACGDGTTQEPHESQWCSDRACGTHAAYSFAQARKKPSPRAGAALLSKLSASELSVRRMFSHECLDERAPQHSVNIPGTAHRYRGARWHDRTASLRWRHWRRTGIGKDRRSC